MQWNNLNNTFSSDAIYHAKWTATRWKNYSCAAGLNLIEFLCITQNLNVRLNVLVGRILGEAVAFGALVRDTLRVIQANGRRAHFIRAPVSCIFL